MPRPQPMADLLDSVFSGTPTASRLREGKIWLVWDTAVGRQIAGKARPQSFRDGILTVAVANAPWMQQLTFLKRDLIQKVNDLLGENLVRDIYLKAGKPLTTPPRPETGGREERCLTGEELSHIEDLAASVSDPELRASIIKLLSRHLADNPADK